MPFAHEYIFHRGAILDDLRHLIMVISWWQPSTPLFCYFGHQPSCDKIGGWTLPRTSASDVLVVSYSVHSRNCHGFWGWQLRPLNLFDSRNFHGQTTIRSIPFIPEIAMGFKGGDLPLNGHSIYSIPEIFIGFEGGNLLLDQFRSFQEFSYISRVATYRWMASVHVEGFWGLKFLLSCDRSTHSSNNKFEMLLGVRLSGTASTTPQLTRMMRSIDWKGWNVVWFARNWARVKVASGSAE